MIGENYDIPIRLPIISGALAGSGRIVCFSQLSFLLNARGDTDTGKLVTRCLTWLATVQSTLSNLYLIGFDSGSTAACAQALERLGLSAEPRQVGDDLSQLRGGIIIPSTLVFGGEEVVDGFVGSVRDSGNGLAVFYVDAGPPTPVSRLLQAFGLSFSGGLVDEDGETCEPAPVAISYESEPNLVSLLDRLWALLAESTVSIGPLDTVLHQLRWHTSCLEGEWVDRLAGVCARAFDWLQRTNYASGATLFPEAAQSLIGSWIVDLHGQLKPGAIAALPESAAFPGSCSGEASVFRMELSVSADAWASTGL
jgi:hypothetical protein